MGWSAPHEDERADYEHDSRKHDSPSVRRSSEPRDAMGVAMLVKCADVTYEQAVEYIEQYARDRADAERLEAVRAGCGR